VSKLKMLWKLRVWEVGQASTACPTGGQ
jgi:hypothetical protein